ncbi:MAG: winged helix-turn-helix transcriptional regulator [Candidatus Micrarchaeota archaeon]|nr:winged helix-turn-helix transcriptional regulator [Candidatus Micrarchaeota archaeon]
MKKAHSDRKLDVISLALEPYVLQILESLDNGPKRFKDLFEKVKNKRTLSKKLVKLQDFGLVEAMHSRVNEGYVNQYKITKAGKELIDAIESIHIK